MVGFTLAGARVASRSFGVFGAAFALSLVTAAILTSAQAQELRVGGCVGSWNSFNCVTRWGPADDPFIRSVPQPTDPAAKAEVEAQDRRWASRCRPSIVQDRYGVARYTYAMPGCEFGVGDIGRGFTR
ncbi:MAG: hypothetical protein ACRECV_19990 [Xanthobacteraceae bacterium]